MASSDSQNNRIRDSRANAFDVLIRRNGWFLLSFYSCWTALAGLLSYARIATVENPPLAWPEIVIIVIVAAAVTVGVAFPLAFGIVEEIPMVLAKLYKDLVREEAREEALKERDLAWEAWLQRREAAERDGLPFTEPPPSRNGTHNENREG